MSNPARPDPTLAGPLRSFLEIPYDQLEVLNLEAKEQRISRSKPEKAREWREKVNPKLPDGASTGVK